MIYSIEMESERSHSSIPNGRERVGIPPTSYEPRNMVVRPPKNDYGGYIIAKEDREWKIPENLLPREDKVLPTPSELKSLETRNWLIHEHYCREEYDICKVLIQEELEKSNGMCEYANYLLGLILRHEGKIQESLEYFQTCHTLNPKSVDNIKQVARSLFLLGNHRQAMEAYFEAEKVADKPDWDIYHNIGMCFFHLKDYAKAKPYLVRAIQLGGQECSFENLAKIHYLEGDVAGALEIYIAGTENNAQSLLRGDKYKKGRVVVKGGKKWWSKRSIVEGEKLPLPDEDDDVAREHITIDQPCQPSESVLIDSEEAQREESVETEEDDEIPKDFDVTKWFADLKASEGFRSLLSLRLLYSSDDEEELEELKDDDFMERPFSVKDLFECFDSK